MFGDLRSNSGLASQKQTLIREDGYGATVSGSKLAKANFGKDGEDAARSQNDIGHRQHLYILFS